LKIYATSSSGTLTSAEIQNLKLYVDGSQVGTTKALNSSLTATFSNLNYVISKGVTKVFTVKGNISADATGDDIYYAYINALGDITAYDSEGNTLTTSGSGLTGTTANSGGTVTETITSVGDVSVARAPDDVESEAGIIVMNGERVLAKFRFTATNEAMTVNDMDLLLNGDNSSGTATSTSAAAVDEVPTIKLYEGTTLLGTYPAIGSGANVGNIYVRDLDWSIPKDGSKTLTVKGVVNSKAAGADTGAEVAVHVLTTNWEAQGSSNLDSTLASGASGREKVVYKTKPTLSVSDPGTALATGEVKVMRVRVAADANEQVAWKKIQLYVAVTDATMTAVTTSNVKVRDVSAGSNLTLSSVHSGAGTASTGGTAIAGGSTGYVSITLDTEQVISAGSYKDYDITLTFADVDAGGNGGQSASLSLYQQASARAASASFSSIEGSGDGEPSFIWSDYSNTSHTSSTSDWANGYYVKELPSDTVTITGS
jgi:hypothetical protein